MSVQYLGSLTVASVFPELADLLDKLQALLTAFATFQVAFEGFSLTMPTLEASLQGVLDLLLTIEGGLDFAINFEFGLGGLKFLAMLDFQACLKISANLGLSISNPLANITMAINAMLQAVASLQASLALGMPTISAELSMQLNVVASVTLAASAKMAGIQIAIDALLSLLGPIVDVRLNIQALLDGILAMFNDLLALFNIMVPSFNLVATLAAQFALCMPNPGVYLYAGDTTYSSYQPVLGPPPSGLTPATTVQSIVMLVNEGTAPDTWSSLQFLVKTSP